MKIKKISKLILGLLVITALLLVIQNKKSTPATFKIGSILPLSGDFGSLGEEIKKGADIALEEAKEQGINIEYISEDDYTEAKGSVNAANKLVQSDKVNAVFTATIQEVKPVAEIFENSKTPLLAVWDSNNYLKTKSPYIFTTGFGTEAAANTMAEYAYQKLKLRKIAIITHIDEWAELITRSFEKKFEELGGKIVMFEKTQVSETNYRSLLAKANASEADGIYFPMIPPAKAPFLKQVKELGIKAALMTGDGFLQDEINEAGAASENVYYTNLYTTNSQELLKKYKTKYNTDPYDIVFASFGYDAIKTLLEARNISLNKKIPLADALTRVKIQGAGGPINMNGKQYSEKLEKLFVVKNLRPTEVK